MKTSKLAESFQRHQKCFVIQNDSISQQVQHSEKHPEKHFLNEPVLKCRYIIVAVGFLMFFLLNAYRMNMSVSIVAMVNNSAPSQYTKARVESCPNLITNTIKPKLGYLSRNEQEGDFAWSPEIQGYILSSFFFGYVISPIPSGILVERFGCKWFLFSVSFITAVCTLLIPLASWLNVTALIAIQTVRGLAQGLVEPAASVLGANWFPKTERGLLYTITLSGSPLGASFGSVFAGFLCASLGRWPSSFYAFGAAGVVLSALIAFFMHENPKVHPRISKAEIEFILSNQETKLSRRRPNAPWRKILTSVPVYAVAFEYFGQTWAMSQFGIVQSTFLGTILHFPIGENGFLTAVPFLLQFITSQTAGWLSSYILHKDIASVGQVRKFCDLLSCLGFSACMLGVYLAGCNRLLSIIFGILSAGCTGFLFAGSRIVPTEMTPAFTGSLVAMCKTFGSMSSVVLPLVVGYLTDEMQTIEQWNKVFFISIGVVMSSGICFAIFGSAEIQKWNYVQEETTEKTEDNTRF